MNIEKPQEDQVDTTDDEYTKSYADIEVHRLMLEDQERMHSFKAAIMQNKDKFKGKVIMDIGAGTGILSIFCALAGAKKVYAVEVSEAVTIARNVVKENNFENIIEIFHSKVEDLELPNNEKVDVIVSEWMGFYLLHEGMLDSVLYARDKFLKDDGCLYPESATLYMAMCSVPSMYDTWKDVYGVKMEYFGNVLRKSKNSKPEIMEVNEEHLLSDEVALAWINLKDITIEELDCFNMKHVACTKKNGNYQGVCIWFDCDFECEYSDDYQVTLSTSPFNKTTHWKQTVIVLPEEQKVEKGQPIAWELNMKRSEESSRRYDLQLTLLDALDETHPLPCDCYLTTCIVTKKYLQENPKANSRIEEE